MLKFLCYLVITAFISLLYSCDGPDYLSEEELSQYILDEDHGLSASVNTNNVSIKATYRPTDLLVAQELRNFENPPAEAIVSAREKYKNYYYFIVSLSNSGKDVLSPSSPGFSELLQTISFRMGEVVNLTTESDTIPVSDFVYNRTFGMSSSTDILFVFEKSKIKNSDWVRINIDEFGLGIGRQSIQLSRAKLDSAPKIFKL